jgi:mono/diheme cytochrome c family protein
MNFLIDCLAILINPEVAQRLSRRGFFQYNKGGTPRWVAGSDRRQDRGGRVGINARLWWIVALVALVGRDVGAESKVDFDSQIKPLLQTRCLSCHGRGKLKGGLSLETREGILQGGEEGPAAVVGKGRESLLVRMVEGLEEGRRMPAKGEPLSRDEIATLRGWIDQGMSWPDGFTFGFRKAPITPRRPTIPTETKGLNHPIDRFLAQGGSVLDGKILSDRVFYRRVALDLIGLLPSGRQIEAFESDTHSDKRAKLVASLLDDRQNYALHWMTFWNDALRNAYKGTGFIDGGRLTITRWLFKALYDNVPYDRFVRELISPVPGSEGFTKGIVWRGVVNASQVPPVQAAQNVAQVFLGTNLKCASCHDSFVNAWKLTDAYALASVFADAPLEINRCDKPTGKVSSIGFIYPELGVIDAKAPRSARMAQLAGLLVKPENGRFSRTIVNRLWAHLMGRGIVEPLDDMDQPAWNQDLLDWLADDFVAHGHDIKHTLALITSSRAYQLTSVGLPSPDAKGPYQFRGPFTRRMSAEQFGDALSTLTGVWPEASGELLTVDGRGQGGQVAAVRAVVAAEATPKPSAPLKVEARWIWSHAGAMSDPGGRILLRKTIRLDKRPERAMITGTCDNEVVFYVNGRRVAASEEWSKPVSADITPLLKVGVNVIAAEATNWPDHEHKKGVQIKAANPAAFLAWVGGFDGERIAWGVGSDASWLWSKTAKQDWKSPGFETVGWSHAAELPGAAKLYGPIDLATAIGGASVVSTAPIRSALVFDDPLIAALGRTSRDQVVTRRDSIATTLQALELSNGSTLDARLKAGALRRFERDGKPPDRLIRSLFVDALGRPPLDAEMVAARDLVGSPATVEGVQDLLWVVVMLPEFQLIP